MEYLALYRKYRPSTLNEMVGQVEIKKILASSIKKGSVSHAYLFSGPRGTGKTSTAKIFAKMVNCENLVDGAPCNCCNSCKSIFNNNDVVEIDAASNNGVDEIRDLREKANLVPSVCKYKVYIIDEVHMLTTQAFNALLKTLEEPPKHVIFILATTEYHKVPLTITSRCQKFQFNKLNVIDNVNKLKEISNLENIDITDDALVEIAKLSDGGMRDSINFLDQLRSFKDGKIDVEDVFDVCGNVSFLEIVNLLENLKNFNAKEITLYIEDLNIKGKNYNKFLEELMLFLRDVVLFKQNVDTDLIKSDINSVKKISSLYINSDIFYILDVINSLLEKLKYVSRQSVLMVVNFLLIAEKISINNNELVKLDIKNLQDNNYELAFNVSSSDNEEKHNDLYDDSNKLSEIDDYVIVNKEIIINNTFAVADKSKKLSLQEIWLTISDYLTDNKFSMVSSYLIDSKVEVAGENYIILTTNYDSVVDNVYRNYYLCEEFIDTIFGDKYHFALITLDEWDKYKNEYVNNLKNNIKYEIKEIIRDKENKIISNNDKEPTIVDKLFDIVGEDSVEFK